MLVAGFSLFESKIVHELWFVSNLLSELLYAGGRFFFILKLNILGR
jgi:hypothetical protein